MSNPRKNGECQQSQAHVVTKKEADQNEENPAGLSDNEEGKDFSASASDWEPSDVNSSSDDEGVSRKKVKMERFGHSYSNKRSSRAPKPSHRAVAIDAFLTKCRKRPVEEMNNSANLQNAPVKNLPDSTRTSNSPAPPSQKSDIVSVNVLEVAQMKQCFRTLFKFIQVFEPLVPLGNDGDGTQVRIVKPEEVNNTINDEVEDDCNMSGRSEDLNRSDDNVLITNKYENANNKVLAEKNKNQNDNCDEWVPIGSGKTLIHKEQYRKINWKSYTVATRSLLLAVFPRRVLATHSLTGKRSPAFQNKPAKMCLDPKLVTDVIIEITDRFKVKENLVRGIITTKCADECKMYKMRQKQLQSRKSTPGRPKYAKSDNDDENGEANQTC